MKWKKAKKTATTTTAILLAIMLTACSDQGNNNVNSSNNNNESQQEEQGDIPSTNLPDGTGVLDPDSPSGDNDDNGSTGTNNGNGSGNSNGNGSSGSNGQGNNSEVVESNVISAKGIYIGAADNHSVEIQVDGEYKMFQVDDSLQYIINDYPSDQAVSFEYVEKTSKELGSTQNWLKSIKLDK